MNAIGETTQFQIGQSGVLTLLSKIMHLAGESVNMPVNRAFRAAIKNTGEVAFHLSPYEQPVGVAPWDPATWTICTENDAVTAATRIVAPGADAIMEFVIQHDRYYFAFAGTAILTAITIPAAPGTGYADPGGTRLPICKGEVRLLSLDHREPFGIAP